VTTGCCTRSSTPNTWCSSPASPDELNGEANKEGVAEGVVSFGAYSDEVPEDVQAAVSEAEEALRSGEAEY